MTAERIERPLQRRFSLTGRQTLFLISLGMVCILAALFRFVGAASVWAAWAVPSKYGGFADLREVLQGIQFARTAAGPSSGLVSGYPGLWSLLGVLGLGPRDTVPVAITIFCAFGAALFLFARRYESLTGVLISLVIFSPAAMLGYERGNLDLAIFAMLAFALWLDTRGLVSAVILVVLASMLKVYPILALGYLLKLPRRRLLVAGGIASAIFITYLVIIGRGARDILTEIPKGDLFAYGTGVISFYLFRMGLTRVWTNTVILLSFVVMYLLAIAVLFASYRRHANALLCREPAPWLDAFRMGSFIYIGTFVAGNSFNYRLLFLVFCIPQLVRWAHRTSQARLEAGAALASLLVSCWAVILLAFAPASLVLSLAQFANWTLFLSLLSLLVISLPDWLFAEIQRFFEKYERFARSKSPGSKTTNPA